MSLTDSCTLVHIAWVKALLQKAGHLIQLAHLKGQKTEVKEGRLEERKVMAGVRSRGWTEESNGCRRGREVGGEKGRLGWRKRGWGGEGEAGVEGGDGRMEEGRLG